jgi:outer membrane receptor protein involved in Fe transport
VVTAQGATLGVTYSLPKNYVVGANLTLATFDIKDANPNNVPGFNTPKYKTAFTFGNNKVAKNVGFNIAWRWQDTYEWYGTFNEMRPGTIEAFSVVDAQVSYKMLPLKSMIKIGANNLFNKQVYQAYGSPSVGAIYYVSLTFDQLLR